MIDPTPIPDEFRIQDLETLKALSHNLRLDLMRLFKEPQTVKQVATKLNKAPTKLYYHINLLEQQGLLTVTDTNIISGIVEKTYRVAARRFHIDESLISEADEVDETITAVIDMILRPARRELQLNLLSDVNAQALGKNLLVRAHYCLTKEEAQDFRQKLTDLVAEYDNFTDEREGVETAVYNFTTLLFPVVLPDQPEE